MARSLSTLFTYKRIQRGWLPALLCGAALMGAFQGTRAGGEVAFQPKLDAAQQNAKGSHRIVFLLFGGMNCGWCHKMDAETFSDPAVLATTQKTVNVRLDTATDEALFRKYHVSETPTCLFLDSDGNEALRVSGFLSPKAFLSVLAAAERAAWLPTSRRSRPSRLPLFFP